MGINNESPEEFMYRQFKSFDGETTPPNEAKTILDLHRDRLTTKEICKLLNIAKQYKINDSITFFKGYKDKNKRPWNIISIHNRDTDNLKPVMKSRARGLSEIPLEDRIRFDKEMENKK